MVLDGMSSELSEKERKRVVRRIQNQIIQYQCNEGKTESLNYIRRELTD